ncbi:MAG: HAD-IA family hydrolase [Sphingomonadaceae bacterium]
MTSSAFDLVVFDFDGTLVDSSGDITASLNHALKKLDRPMVDPEEVRAMVGHGGRALLERALGESGGFTPELVKQGLRLFLDYYGANIAVHTRPFPGLEPLLDRLTARDVRLAICTNKMEGLSHQLVKALGWEQRFSAILGADSRPFRKPDPRHLTETIAAAGGGRALFVGDSRTDADTAIAAQIPLILVSFGFSTDPVEELGANQLIDHYDAFEDAMMAIQAQLSADTASTSA